MFSDYLNAVEICERTFEKAAYDNINLVKKYPPRNPKDLENEIARLTKRVVDAKAVLSDLIDTIIPLYKNILSK